MLCLGMVSTNLFRLFYAGEIQNLNCRRLEMATYSGIYFFTRGCTQTPTYNSMFARLGMDYEIRNQCFFAILEAMTTD